MNAILRKGEGLALPQHPMSVQAAGACVLHVHVDRLAVVGTLASVSPMGTLRVFDKGQLKHVFVKGTWERAHARAQ